MHYLLEFEFFFKWFDISNDSLIKPRIIKPSDILLFLISTTKLNNSEKIDRLVNTNFPKVYLKVAFKSPKEIGNCFHFKDRPTDVIQSCL